VITFAVEQHLISGKGLLEARTHEAIAGTRLGKDSKVDIKEGEVDHERNKDETNCPCSEMFPKVILFLNKKIS
jgi:hypothetical protein